MKNQQQIEDGWFFHNHAWHLLHEIIKLIPDDCESLLDCGAGTGIAAAVIQAIFPKLRIEVTDISKESLDFWVYRQINGSVVRNERLDNFNDNEMDFVMSSHVLEHVNDPVLFVSEMIRVAKKRVVIVVPDGEVGDPTHKIKYNRIIFEQVLYNGLQEHDFRELHTFPVYHPHINNLVGVIDL